VNGHGLPLQLELSAGEAHDAPVAASLFKDLPEGTSLLADRGYDADWIRELIYQHKSKPVIPPKSNRRDFIYYSKWPAAGSVDTEIRCLMELEGSHAEKDIQPRVQA